MFRRIAAAAGTLAVAVPLLLAGPAAATSAQARPNASSAAGADCIGPAGDPAPGTTAWTARDLENVLCSTQRMTDEVGNPAVHAAFATEAPGLFANQTLSQLNELGSPRATLAQLVPGATAADPMRVLSQWNNVRGRVQPISFTATDGALLHGHIFEPLHGTGPFPAVVVTTGSIQGYEQLYYWAAEGLAEAGYLVLTYDVQGQGSSETLPHPCTATSCPGVPFQQPYNFIQGTEDALNFLFSTPAQPTARGEVNPAWAALDRAHVGLAGHSLGASAVSQVGQTDHRVSAIVAWDNLSPQPANVTLRTPALGFNSEYFLNPEPMSSPPDPHSKDQAFQQLRDAHVDSMQVALRSSTHLEYSYIPCILPASRLGERVTFYYTLAWFDRYLKGPTDASIATNALNRLAATSFDSSSDAHSIGAGTFDLNAALQAHSVTAGNVPYRIAGMPVADRLSVYYSSGYDLAGGSAQCGDLRHGCS